MIEHREWCGSKYLTEGINNQRIAIVGYSHWEGEYPDREDATIREITQDCTEPSHRFFSAIVSYFDVPNNTHLWDRVVFFNFLPNVVGKEHEKYGYGTQQQHALARSRFMRILAEHAPKKILVFSTKAWGSLPALREQDGDPNGPIERLGADLPESFKFGTYESGGNIATTYGLRHPQGARTDVMKRAVTKILSVT